MNLCGVSQIRFYKDDDPRNVPFPKKESYAKPFYLEKLGYIRSFQVYALPGTRIWCNTTLDIYDPVNQIEVNKPSSVGKADNFKHLHGFDIGDSGVLTIDAENTDLGQLKFIFVDLHSLENINTNQEGYVIINFLHEVEE